MNYKIIVLAPSCGGKSSLMHYLRKHTDLDIAETDEEVMKSNNDIWPDDDLKNKVLVPKTTREIITKDRVIYFASYIPTKLLQEAKEKGFMIVVLNIAPEELLRRNEQRMKDENYNDVSQWFNSQLANFNQLTEMGVVNKSINGDQAMEKLAAELQELAKK